MNVKNCRKCGMLFNYITGPQICPQCRAKVEEKFQEVKKYVYNNKGATMPQIAEACDVEMAQIQAWVREERLCFAEDSPISIGCEMCGTMIKTGRFCAKCKADMTNNLNGVMPKKQSPLQSSSSRDRDPAKMRFL